jgi:hypothetical protein
MDAQTGRFFLRIGVRMPGYAPSPCMGYQNACVCESCVERAHRMAHLSAGMPEHKAAYLAAKDSGQLAA